MAHLRRRCSTAISHAHLLTQQSAGLSLVAANLLRGAMHPWRGAHVAGGADQPLEAAGTGQRHFAGRPEDVRAVRTFVRGAALDAGVDPDAAVLAASELATNVVLHAETPFTVSVESEPGLLRVAFSDGSAILPAIAHIVLEGSEHGRGMRIVESVTACWGTDLAASGKIVWFEIDR